MKKKTRLTIETERVFVIRRGRAVREVVCEACQEVIQLLTLDEAAALARVSAEEIYKLMETEKIHFTEIAEDLLICLNSLCQSLLGADARCVNDSSNWEGENRDS